MTDFRLVAGLLAFIFTSIGIQAIAEAPKKEREGGIIGTGIVGTVTELGSIIVNDQRVTFGADTMAVSVLGGQLASDLTPGDTVVVVAERLDQEWQAKSIEQNFVLVGPVLRDGDTLTVLGSSLDLSSAASAVQTYASGLTNGDWVAVSGLWKDQIVMASNLTPSDRSLAVLSGSYVPGRDADAFKIGGSLVSGLDLDHVERGQIVTVTGLANSAGIDAQTVRIGLFSGPMRHVIAQGFMSKPADDGFYTILGSGAVSFTDQPHMIDTQTVGLYCISQDPTIGEAPILMPGVSSCQ